MEVSELSVMEAEEGTQEIDQTEARLRREVEDLNKKILQMSKLSQVSKGSIPENLALYGLTNIFDQLSTEERIKILEALERLSTVTGH